MEMSTLPPQSDSISDEATISGESRSASSIVKKFLLQNEPAFRSLDELREKVSLCRG
jgi:hypothetical protein